MINSSVSNSTSNIYICTYTSLEALDLSHTSIVQRLYREYSKSVHSHKFPEVKELRGMDQSSQPFFGKNESKHSGAEQPTEDMAGRGHTFFPFSNLRRNSFGKSGALSA